MIDNKEVIAVILAAGAGSRYKAEPSPDVQKRQQAHKRQEGQSGEKEQSSQQEADSIGAEDYKQFDFLAGKPVIDYSIECFAKCEEVDSTILVLPPPLASWDEFSKISSLGQKQLKPAQDSKEDFTESSTNNSIKAFTEDATNASAKIQGILAGGDARADSTANAVAYLREQGKTDDTLVLIHDAARPLISEELVQKCLLALKENDGVTAGRPMHDSLVSVGEKTEGKMSSLIPVKKSLRRDMHYGVQTPQAFSLGLLREALSAMSKAEDKNSFTDEVSIILAYKPDARIQVVISDRSNIKLTHPEDKVQVEAFLRNRA